MSIFQKSVITFLSELKKQKINNSTVVHQKNAYKESSCYKFAYKLKLRLKEQGK